MRIRATCATAALAVASSCLLVHSGALKKSFTKDEQSENIKIEEQNASSEGEGGAKDSKEQNGESSKEEKNSESSASETKSESTASTEKKKIVGDPVVLRINGKKEFRRSQILEDMKLIPPQMLQGVSPDKLFELLRDQKLNAYLMIGQAKKAGMDRTKEFLDRIEKLKEEMLGRIFLMRELAPKAENESELKARYTKYLVEFKKGKEFQLAHIMVSAEEDAKAILGSIEKGADFSKLAKEKSVAPSKDKSGDEGYIPVDIMPVQIKDKIIVLKVGEYTKEPIKTDNGFHIFKVVDIRDSSPQKYEDALPMLKQTIMHEEMMKLLDKLEKQVKVERFNEDGTPVPPRAAAEMSQTTTTR